ncbi:MAG TPA: hypothetical protein VES59_06985 [Bacteroidota bacterium]|nr:hypothetical protein [Bacteroidota bacterium]
MKHAILLCLLIILTVCASEQLFPQTDTGDRLTVPLSDPSRPAFLKVGLISGSITVEGYSGKEIVVEGNTSKEDDDGQESEKTEKTRGLHRIANTSTGLTVEEDNNEVTVGTGGMGGSRTINLTIKVPPRTSMKLSTINSGVIKVSHVNGDLEASNTNGSIEISDVNGSAVVDALNGNITVTFTGVNPQKSMSFSSLNGTIDVTFPSDVRATVKMKTEQGEIYSDFDIKLSTSTTKMEENERGKRGKYRVTLEKMMTGTINGGGAEVQFKNFNGDIYIRKGK